MENAKSDVKKKSHGLTPFQGASFLFGVAGLAAAGGFGMMFAQARKRNPEDFYNGIAPQSGQESGARLALRALGRATVYSVGGFSLCCFVIWKMMGVNNLKEFTKKMQGIMPSIPPAANSTGEDIDWDEIFKGKPKANVDNNVNLKD